MALTVVGINHRTAPVAVREKVSCAPSETPELAARLRELAAAREVVVLSTCNRTELYVVDGEGDPVGVAHERLDERLGDDASKYTYVHRDRDVADHLFHVASGLDSMILGEAQIHGQVRTAWERSRPTAGPVLNRLFQTALQVGGRVRNETAIGRGAASVSSAAVQLAKQIFGSLAGRRAMILGAGEMAELALECLVSEGVRAAIVANRTFERAGELAGRHGARAMRFEECWAAVDDVDLIICSTAAPHPVVLPENLRGAVKRRGDQPLCVLDIALPRDVDPAVGKLDNVFLYDLDDLRAVVAATIEERRKDLPPAEQLIGEEVARFWDWMAGLAAVPVLKSFRAEMDELREQELAHAMRKLGHLSPEDREAVEHFSRALMNKFLHEPTVRLRAAAANGRGLLVVDTMRYLFALDEQRGAPPEGADAADSQRTGGR